MTECGVRNEVVCNEFFSALESYLLVDTTVARPSDDVLVVLVATKVSNTVAEGNVLDELRVALGCHFECVESEREKWVL